MFLAVKIGLRFFWHKMSTCNRHNSSSSSSAERKSSVSDNSSNKKVRAVMTHLTKKRPALADITSQRNASVVGARTSTATLLKPLVVTIPLSTINLLVIDRILFICVFKYFVFVVCCDSSEVKILRMLNILAYLLG